MNTDEDGDVLVIAQPSLEEHFEKVEAYLSQFLNLEKIIYTRNYSLSTKPVRLYLKGMGFLMQHFPGSLKEFCVGIDIDDSLDESSKSYFLDNIKQFLRKHPGKTIHNYHSMSELEFRKIMERLRARDLPYKQLEGYTYEGNIRRPFSDYYAEFDRAA